MKYENVPVIDDDESSHGQRVRVVTDDDEITINLNPNDINFSAVDNVEFQSHTDDVDERSSVYVQLNLLCRQAFPVILSFFLGILGSFINLAFAGHMGNDNERSVIFAGITLANMFCNVSLMSLLIGMSSAVETLASQNNGAKNYKEVGIVLQRSIIILSVMSIPLCMIWFFVKEIFLSIGVERNVAEVIKNYLMIRLLAIPADILNISMEKYMIAIGVMNPSMWSNIYQNLSILALNTLFVHVLHLDYRCLAWSWVISTYVSGIGQALLGWNHPSVQRTLQPLDWAALTKWHEFIALGLPGTLMLCSEWWAYEVLALFASQLGTREVDAQAIILQTAALAFMIPLGLGIASTSVVGNAVGAGKIEYAIRIGKLSLGTIVVLEIFLGLMIYFGGRYFVQIFTSDAEVLEVAYEIMPFLSMFAMIDGLQGVSSGILKGAGKQSLGAMANICAFYGIGLPMAWFFCFRTSLKVRGLMIGISCGVLCQLSVILSIIFFREDYLYTRAISTESIEMDCVAESIVIDNHIDNQSKDTVVVVNGMIEMR